MYVCIWIHSVRFENFDNRKPHQLCRVLSTKDLAMNSPQIIFYQGYSSMFIKRAPTPQKNQKPHTTLPKPHQLKSSPPKTCRVLLLKISISRIFSHICITDINASIVILCVQFDSVLFEIGIITCWFSVFGCTQGRKIKQILPCLCEWMLFQKNIQ